MKPKKKPSLKKHHIILLVIGILVIGISILFIFISPSEIIEKLGLADDWDSLMELHPKEIVATIGVTNSYLVIAFFALFGGFSAFTSVSFYATVITFTTGGLNPIYVALVAAPGLFIGDNIYYIFGNSFNRVLSKRMKRFVNKINQFINRPKIYKISPLLIFLYVGVTPLPPDILIVALSISKYPYKRMIVPLLLGEINFVFWVSFFAKRGIELFGF